QNRIPQPAVTRGPADFPQKTIAIDPITTSRSAALKSQVAVSQHTKLPVVTETAKMNSRLDATQSEKSNIRHVDRVEKAHLPATENIAHDRHDRHAAVHSNDAKIPSLHEGMKRVAVSHSPETHHLATTTERLKTGKLDHVVNSPIARQVELKKQF